MFTTVSRPIADPLGDARSTIDAIKFTIGRLIRENIELRARLLHAERMALPRPIRDAHAVELLDLAAAEAEGDTVDAVLADAWDRWMRMLDEEVTA